MVYAREISLRAIWSMIARHRRAIIVLASVLITLSIVCIACLPAVYTSEAVVVIDTRKNKLNDLQSVLSNVPLDSGAITSEVDVLQSQSLAQSVARDVDYAHSDEFLQKGVHNRLSAFVERFRSLMPDMVSEPVAPLFEAVEQLADRGAAGGQNIEFQAAALQRHIAIVHEPRTFTIKLRYTSADPVWAARVANAYVDAYIRQQVAAKAAAAGEATAWLGDRVEQLRARVAKSDAAVEKYREVHKLADADPKSGTPVQQELVELNSKLVEARADAMQAEARYHAAAALVNKGEANSESVSAILNSPLIQKLREQQSSLRQHEAELGSVYGDRHPEMIKVRSAIAELDRKIVDESRRIMTSLQSDAAAAAARAGLLAANIQTLKKSVTTQSHAGAQLKILEKEADTDRVSFESFLGKYHELSAQNADQQAEARLVSEAQPPLRRSAPNRLLLAIAAVLGSFGVSIALALIADRRIKGFRTTAEASEALALRSLGIIPKIMSRELRHRRSDVSDMVFSDPGHPYNEMVRLIRTSIGAGSVVTPSSILVTSSAPSEGKTTLAISMARELAASGRRCILVDADLRRPRVHRVLGGTLGPGLAEILSGRAEGRQVLQQDTRSPLIYMSAGGVDGTAPVVFEEKACRALISALEGSADVVIIDSPPVLAASDALVLGRAVDAAVMVVHWGSTPRNVVTHAVEQMRALNLPMLGFVLTQVDVAKLLSSEIDRQAYAYTAGYRYKRVA
jgi:polysaccharide biosynthesis transport protein